MTPYPFFKTPNGSVQDIAGKEAAGKATGLPYPDARNYLAACGTETIFRGQEEGYSPLSRLARLRNRKDPHGPFPTDVLRAFDEMLDWLRDEIRRYNYVQPWTVSVPPTPGEELTMEEANEERRLFKKIGWEMLAQHYGIPTRLIDWSESYHTALFFAYGGWSGNDVDRKSPCVWCLNLGRFERGAKNVVSKPGFARGIRDYYKDVAGAVRIVHHNQIGNPRQRAQRGYFTFAVNPEDIQTPIDSHISAHAEKFEAGTLMRVLLDPGDQMTALKDLADGGSTAGVIRNDLEGISRDAVNRFIRERYI